MSVVNGQPANAATFNNAFVSKTADSTVVSNIEFADTDVSQGTTVTQAQRELNSLNSFTGKSVNAAKDVLPTWVDNSIGTATDTLKDRAEALTTATAGKEDSANKGVANGYCPLDATAKVDEAYLPASIVGQLYYKGTWDASSNTPSISDATGEVGWFYYVSAGGTQDLGSGSIVFNAGDSVIHDGTIWEKIDGSQQQHKVEYRTISGGEATAKQLTLAETPTISGEVMLAIKGGTVQFYGDDFTVSGNVLSWSGLELDGVLDSGDKIILQYVY